ncbi:uncharacterized protein LOC122235300 [Panthera tigris]|uniref:uncharacterized protein LOC122235300 n=1 Tax=Panthera tigris TaxID=9694 RepID=UPI001C6FA229|nr:uncharacterized protein LOC122235300 [Panthera tigris]
MCTGSRGHDTGTSFRGLLFRPRYQPPARGSFPKLAFTLGAVGWRAASSKSSPITCPWNLRTSLRCHPFLPTLPPLLQHLRGLRSLAVSEPNRLPLGPPPGFRCPLPYCPSQLRNSEAVGVPGRHRLLPALPVAPCTRPLLRDTVPHPHHLSLGPFGLLQPNTTDSVAHLFLKFPEAGSPRPVRRDNWLLVRTLFRVAESQVLTVFSRV